MFAATLLVFVIAAVYSELHMNSLMKILELRHSATYAKLGRPHPLRTGESDRHSAALLRFVMSKLPAALCDAELDREIRMLRCSFAVNLITVLTVFLCLFFAPDAKALVTFACLQK